MTLKTPAGLAAQLLILPNNLSNDEGFTSAKNVNEDRLTELAALLALVWRG